MAIPLPLDHDCFSDGYGGFRMTTRAGRTLYVVTAGQGALDSKGVAAEGTVELADGSVATVRWLVGEHAWPVWAGATGRGADRRAA